MLQQTPKALQLAAANNLHPSRLMTNSFLRGNPGCNTRPYISVHIQGVARPGSWWASVSEGTVRRGRLLRRVNIPLERVVMGICRSSPSFFVLHPPLSPPSPHVGWSWMCNLCPSSHPSTTASGFYWRPSTTPKETSAVANFMSVAFPLCFCLMLSSFFFLWSLLSLWN